MIDDEPLMENIMAFSFMSSVPLSKPGLDVALIEEVAQVPRATIAKNGNNGVTWPEGFG